MKIIRNIPAAMKVLGDVIHYNKYKKKIDNAKASGNLEEERRLILEATSGFGPKTMDQFGVDLHVHGEENIPESGPVVLMLNHQSYADIPVMFAVFRKFQFGFIAKRYLAKAPVIGEWMPRIRSVFIENDDPREALKAINQGIEYPGNRIHQRRIFPGDLSGRHEEQRPHSRAVHARRNQTRHETGSADSSGRPPRHIPPD